MIGETLAHQKLGRPWLCPQNYGANRYFIGVYCGHPLVAR
jgi:hypothetical protein